MEVFSLEEDDCNELFITQSCSGDNNSVNSSVNDGFSGVLGDPMDFASPCSSLVNAHYSDISDDDFEIPSSQMANTYGANAVKTR